MANQKISALTAATTPLAGTELVPLVQSSATRRATVAQIRDAREIIQLSCSDLTTALAPATNVGYVRAPRAFMITAIRASLLTASSSGVVTIDVNKNGSTILSTKLTIDANETTSVTAATPPVISDTAVADDDLLAIDIDGAGTNAAGLILTFIGTPS